MGTYETNAKVGPTSDVRVSRLGDCTIDEMKVCWTHCQCGYVTDVALQDLLDVANQFRAHTHIISCYFDIYYLLVNTICYHVDQ